MENAMKAGITIVVAMNKERVIGADNQLPWHIPEDLAYFKQVTLGKPIIMGRKTFESIGRVLPGRKNIVVSRNGYVHDGVVTYASLKDAINDNQDVSELCVIGGGEIFRQALDFADTLHITEVDYPVANPGTWFPEINEQEWDIIIHSEFTSSKNVKCVIKEYRRKL